MAGSNITESENVNCSTLDFGNFHNIINGVCTRTKSTRHGINPSNLQANPEVPVSTEEDVDRAIAAAKIAAVKWGERPVAERQQAVLKFADAIEASKADFGALLTREQGRPLPLAMAEIENGIYWLRAMAKIPFPEEIIEDDAEKLTITRYVPLGVAVGIVPWNYPVMLACGKLAPAIIAGNAFIMKPSPFTPYCGLKMVELGQKFFPPGVFQVLSGGDDLGPWLTSKPGIDKVSFTGSTATGKLVMANAAKTLKRITLELGGNDAAIVCEDIEIAQVASQISFLAFLNSGQVCVAIKRVYVHSSIYDKFLEELVRVVNAIVVGDGFAPGVFNGPIQNEMQFKRVKEFLREINEKKLKIATTERPSKAGEGYFLDPIIIDNPPDDAQIVVEEPFGPILPLMKWTDEMEVLTRANDTDLGLGASVWTQNMKRANRMASKLKAGSVWVNTHMAIQPTATFGGHKQSGIGSEWGTEGLRSYCNTQTLFLRK